MSKYKIEKNVPVQDGHGNKKYPFKQMEVGDSFLAYDVPAVKMHAAASQAGRRYGLKFKVRKQEKGARVWRIA